MPRHKIVYSERWDVIHGADPTLDEAVRAMAHPGRRAMLRRARDEERSATELAEAAGLTPSAASPHLKLLREVGLMHMRVDAKRRMYRVDLKRLQAVRLALDELWDDRLDALRTLAESDAGARAYAEGESA
jgi:DNA-binding transcriptional ArsR family regulator